MKAAPWHARSRPFHEKIGVGYLDDASASTNLKAQRVAVAAGHLISHK